MRRMCRVKNPWLCVAKEAWPFAPAFLILADSQATGRVRLELAGLGGAQKISRRDLDMLRDATKRALYRGFRGTTCSVEVYRASTQAKQTSG